MILQLMALLIISENTTMTKILNDITEKLTQLRHTVTCAESCTGGLLAAALTSLPGSSNWFNMGYITYSNQAKQQLLKVNPMTLKHYGAVSEECVREMALGALINAKADYALSVSGIAGPDGGSDDKPVGTVWFGLATKQRIWAKQYLFQGDREAIRAQAVTFALQFLYQYLNRN